MAHGTYVFFGGLLWPKGRNSRPKAESSEGFLGRMLPTS